MKNPRRYAQRLLADGLPELRRRRVSRVLAAICVAAVLAHLPLLWGDFVDYDDGVAIFKNPIMTNFTREHFVRVLLTNYRGTASAPMHTVNFFNWEISGGDYTGFALFNLLWLVFSIIVFHRFAALFLPGQISRLFATAVFALHGANADSYGWMSSRCHIFGLVFLMLAFICWQRYKEAPDRLWRLGWYVLAFVSAAAAVWNKSIFFMTPFLLGVYDLYRRDRLHALLVLDKIPMIAVASITLTQPPHAAKIARYDVPAMGSSVWATLYNDAGLLMEYLRHLALPGPTTIAAEVAPVESIVGVSAHSGLEMLHLPPVFHIGALLLLLSGALWWSVTRRRRTPLFTVLFLLACFAPVMNIPPRWVRFAFRFELMPTLFYSVAVAAVGAYAWHRSRVLGRAVLVVAFAALMAWNGYRSFVQSSQWDEQEIYWEGCLEHYPDSYICYEKLISRYRRIGRRDDAHRALLKWDEILTVVGSHNRWFSAIGLAKSFERRGDLERARFYYERALLRDRLNSTARKRAKKAIKRLDGRLEAARESAGQPPRPKRK